MAVFWAEMGVVYLEINKRPCLQAHAGQKNKSININY
jgi:hypothetical protein